MSKREVFSCDRCGEDIVQKYLVTAFNAERHLCFTCAGQLEMWIKPFMAKLQGYKVEIVYTKIEPAPQADQETGGEG